MVPSALHGPQCREWAGPMWATETGGPQRPPPPFEAFFRFACLPSTPPSPFILQHTLLHTLLHTMIATTRPRLPNLKNAKATRAARARAALPVRRVLRAVEETTTPAPEEPVVETPVVEEPVVAAPTEAAPFSLLNGMSEVMNGRAAMVGMLAALASELATGKPIWTQIFGQYSDGDLVAAGSGQSVLLYGFAVVFVLMGSLSVKLQGVNPEDRSFGPFSANAEMLNGRIAMMGFSGLLIAENFTQGAIF